MNNRTPTPLLLEVQSELQELAANIKLARKRRKISLANMAERTGSSVSTLSRLEGGDHRVAIGTVLQVLSVLGLLRGLAQLSAPENDVEQTIHEVRNLRLKRKGSGKRTIPEEELQF